jgi:hypothetical protein
MQHLLDNGQIAFVEQAGGRLGKVLSEHGLTGKAISESSAVQRFDGSVIVLGPNADKSPALTTAALETADSGRTVLWLEPGDTSKWQGAFNLPKEQALSSSETAILAPGHTAFTDMDESDLAWQEIEDTFGLAMTIPDGGNFRRLLISKSGEAGIGLIELFPARGRIIICRLPVVSLFNTEPAARMLFENLLHIALSETPQFSAASIWSPPSSGLSQLVEKSAVDISGPVVPKGVMVVAADAESAAYALENDPTLPEKIRGHLEGGGKCVFIGASPESVPFLEKCGLRDVSFEPSPKNVNLSLQPVPLLWGISREQLAAASAAGGQSLVKYVVSSQSKVNDVVSPGIIAKAQVGYGEAILCQISLDCAPEDPACIVLLQELLTNLGVRIERKDQP